MVWMVKLLEKGLLWYVKKITSERAKGGLELTLPMIYKLVDYVDALWVANPSRYPWRHEQEVELIKDALRQGAGVSVQSDV